MIDAQNGRCAICKIEFGGDKANVPHLDHDHKTRAIRGVLCFGCNVALGRFNDDPDLLDAAKDYLLMDRPDVKVPLSGKDGHK